MSYLAMTHYLASVSVGTPALTPWVTFLLGVIVGMIIAIKVR